MVALAVPELVFLVVVAVVAGMPVIQPPGAMAAMAHMLVVAVEVGVLVLAPLILLAMAAVVVVVS
jgi:hypothetical protein